MATLGNTLGWVIVDATIFGWPLVLFCYLNADSIWSRWEVWWENRGWRTYRFVVTAYPDEYTAIELPVWFEERDFGDAAQDAIELQERLFASWMLVGIKAVDRSWGYIREPEWGDDVKTQLVERTQELLEIADGADDLELTIELTPLIKRLLFVVESEAAPEEMEGAWAIVEEDIAHAFERAKTRRKGLESR